MTEIIQDGLSRQRRWQIKRVAEGKCRHCGKDRQQEAAAHCDACGLKAQKKNRKTRGAKKRKEGGMGRPPLYVTKKLT